MAKEDKKQQAAPAGTISAEDRKKALAALGISDEDLTTVGGLGYIIPAEVLFDTKAEVIGRTVALLDMPPRLSMDAQKRKAGVKEPWQAAVIKLAVACPGKKGKDADIITIDAGEQALVPITGSLKNNPDFLNALIDPDNSYVVTLSVPTQTETGQPTPMYDFKVQVALDKPYARKNDPDLAIVGRSFGAGANALIRGQKPNASQLRAAAGTYDPKTGEVKQDAPAAS